MLTHTRYLADANMRQIRPTFLDLRVYDHPEEQLIRDLIFRNIQQVVHRFYIIASVRNMF